MRMKLHKKLLLFSLYFFFNPLGLPLGLLHTTWLAPIAYFSRLTKRKMTFLVLFFFVSSLFCGLQLLFLPQIDYYFYFRSFIWSFFIVLSVYQAAKILPAIPSPARLFSQLIWVNFGLTCLGIVFYFTSYSDLFWVSKVITSGTEAATRFKMFTSEPAHYSFAVAPLFIFAFVAFLQNKKKNWLPLLLTLFPLGLSFSLGVLVSLALAIGLAGILYFNRLFRRWSIFTLLGIALIIVAVLLSTENLLSTRVANVISGNDSSSSGRTFQSFLVSWDLAQANNLWLGVGLGQSKIQLPLFFSQRWPGLEINRVINAVAGTLAEFGLIGLSARFLAELFLFFSTRVYKSYFRLTLFLFVFIYQFTGSFTTNFVEYTNWLFAFLVVFPEFEFRQENI